MPPKIKRAEDLAAIATWASARSPAQHRSVSRFTLTTRERIVDSPEGTQIVISGGKILEVKAAGTAPGTTVEVRQLFFSIFPRAGNFSARRDGVRPHQHYLTWRRWLPGVAFNLPKRCRLVWQLPAVKAVAMLLPGSPPCANACVPLGDEQTFAPSDFSAESALPNNRRGCLFPSTLNSQLSTLSALGFTGSPVSPRTTREDQHIFVNRRPVGESRTQFRVLEGLHTALMKSLSRLLSVSGNRFRRRWT